MPNGGTVRENLATPSADSGWFREPARTARQLPLFVVPRKDIAMTEKIDAILETLDEARRQIADAKMTNANSDGVADTLEAVEEELDEIREQLGRLKKTAP